MWRWEGLRSLNCPGYMGLAWWFLLRWIGEQPTGQHNLVPPSFLSFPLFTLDPWHFPLYFSLCKLLGLLFEHCPVFLFHFLSCINTSSYSLFSLFIIILFPIIYTPVSFSFSFLWLFFFFLSFHPPLSNLSPWKEGEYFAKDLSSDWSSKGRWRKPLWESPWENQPYQLAGFQDSVKYSLIFIVFFSYKFYLIQS